MSQKFLDVYIDHQLVETVQILDVAQAPAIKSELLEKYKGKGLVALRKRSAPVELKVVSGGCEGGSCPVRTEVVEQEVAPVETPNEAIDSEEVKETDTQAE